MELGDMRKWAGGGGWRGGHSLPKGTFSSGRAPGKLGPSWLASRAKPGRNLPEEGGQAHGAQIRLFCGRNQPLVPPPGLWVWGGMGKIDSSPTLDSSAGPALARPQGLLGLGIHSWHLYPHR